MSDITDSMARYIDNIPDGAAHTCSDLCIKPSCLIVRGKQEIESLRKERQQWLTKSKQWGRKIETLEAQVAWMCEAIDEKRARCVELGGLLHEAMEDVKFHLECVSLAENAKDEAVLDDRLYRIRAALGTRADQPSSAPAVRCPATLGNAGQCVKEAGHGGQHSLVDVTRPDDRWAAADQPNERAGK